MHRSYRFQICLFIFLISALIEGTSLYAQRGLNQIPDPDPKKQLESFQLADGFQVNLFAADPMIQKPIQMNWDARGRLWVATSNVYPHLKPGQKANDKIYVLEDTDRDGKADRSIIFAEGLLIPTAILPGDGGVYVGSSTDLLFLKDTDGDGKADQRQVLLTGFGTEDTHHIIHTLRRGPDGRIYFNQSIYIHSHIETPWGVKRLLAGGTWRFEPEALKLEVFSRGLINPWGHQFDHWGQSFQTDGAGSDGIHFVFPGAVFRTAYNAKRILPGLNPGQPKHCGLAIVSGRQFPNTWQGRFITNDFRGNRINSFVLAESGSGYFSKKAEDLISSSHVAFRPVDTLMGPDGAIYIADWYNPIIQHGEVDFRDPRRDHEHGRIWRVTAKNRAVLSYPAIEQQPVETLLEKLKSPEQWTREQVREALRKRGSKQVLPHLANWLKKQDGESEQAVHLRLQGLWLYQSLNQVNQALLESVLSCADHHARAAGVRVLADWVSEIENREALLRDAVADEHPQVRLEAVRAAARLGTTAGAKIAALALAKPVDDNMDFAIWLTMRELAPHWVPALQQNPEWFGEDVAPLLFAIKAAEDPAALAALKPQLAAGKLSQNDRLAVLILFAELGTAADLQSVLQAATSDNELAGTLLPLLVSVSEKRSLKPNGDLTGLNTFLAKKQIAAIKLAGLWKVQETRPQLKSILLDEDNAPVMQQAAIKALAALGGGDSQRVMLSVLKKNKSQSLRLAALAGLADIDIADAAQAAIPLLQNQQQNEHARVYEVFIKRKGGAVALGQALEKKKLPTRVASLGYRLTLNSPGKQTALLNALQAAGSLKPIASKPTPEEVRQLAQSVIDFGNITRGETVYRKQALQCINCHAIGGAGGLVGPDLTSIGASAPVDYLVESLVDPSKKIKEGYHVMTVLDDAGLTTSGVLLQEGEGGVKLRLADGNILSINSNKIEEKIRSPISLMPFDIVSKMRRDELIDLVAFLSALGKSNGLKVTSNRYVRTWQALAPNNQNKKAVNDTIRHIGLHHVASDDPSLPWSTVYSKVTGELPLNQLAWMGNIGGRNIQAVRFFLGVVQPGALGIKIDNPNGLRMWQGKAEIPVKPLTILNLKTGLQRITITSESARRKMQPLRIEVVDVAGSQAQVRLVNQPGIFSEKPAQQ